MATDASPDSPIVVKAVVEPHTAAHEETTSAREPRSLRLSRAYLSFLHRVRYPMLMLYLILTVGLAFAAVEFPGDVTNNVTPPADSAAYKAREKVLEYYPAMMEQEGMILLAQSTNRPVYFDKDIDYQAFDTALNYWAYTGELPPDPLHVVVPQVSRWVIAAYASYRSTTASFLGGDIADVYLANGGTATFALVSFSTVYNGPDKVTATEFVKRLNHDAIPQLLQWYSLNGNITMTPLGLSAFMVDIAEATSNDMIILFALVTPLTLIIFGYSLSSVRIVLLPILSLVVTTSFTFAFMHFVAVSIDVNSMAPGICAAVCLVLSFSFAYTIAAKFQRETLDQLNFGNDRHMIVLELVMAYSGRTVFVSGVTIALCTMGLVFFPIEMLRSIGLSCLLASLSAVVVSISVIPTVLLCAPRFFTNGVGDWVWPVMLTFRHFVQRPTHEHPNATTTETQQQQQFANSGTALGMHDDGPSVLRQTPRVAFSHSASALVHASQAGQHHAHRRGPSSVGASSFVDSEISRIEQQDPQTRASHKVQRVRFFYKHFIAFMAQTPVAIVSTIIVIGLCMYPMTQAFSTKYSNDLTQYVPRDSKLLPAWDFMKDNFRAGEVFQYTMIVEFPFMPEPLTNPADLYNPRVFAAGAGVVESLIELVPGSTAHTFDSVFWDGVQSPGPDGGPIEYMFVMNCTMCSFNFTTFACNYAPLTPWMYANMKRCLFSSILYAVFIGPTRGNALWIQTRLDFNPLEEQGIAWYRRFMEVRPQIEERHNVKLYLEGYAADTIDLVDFATQRFPLVVGLVSVILFISMMLLCMSLGVPIRALIIVFVTTATCFGIANLVFIKGVLHWLPIVGLQGKEGTVAWLMPFSTLLLIVGICLHYDLSIVLRVKQFHHHGHDTRAAIILAAQETGSEITVSAALTIFLFSGLIFSQVPAMNQLGFYLLLSALLEGILFRLFLSTTLMAVLGEWNWFPMNLIRPQHHHALEEDGLLEGGDGVRQLFGSPGGQSRAAETDLMEPAAVSTPVTPRGNGLHNPHHHHGEKQKLYANADRGSHSLGAPAPQYQQQRGYYGTTERDGEVTK
jgi:predicted RND superfamily exporter protein